MALQNRRCAINFCWLFLRHSAWDWRNTCCLYGIWRSGALVKRQRSHLVRAILKGVISSETANNAATGAAMIPLLALGLPGGALTAMMVAVFQMHDMEPGPLVFYNSPDLIWVVFAAMFYANVSILFIGLLKPKLILNLLKIPFHFLAP